MPPHKSEWDKQMQQLDSEIRRLEAEYNMFFAGRLPRPPWETRARVVALVKKHDQSFIRNTADRFRFESLQSRFQKFLELCDRQMTNRELGRPMPGMKRTEEPKPKAAKAAEDAPKAAEGTTAPAAASEAPKAAQAPEAPKAPLAPEVPKAPRPAPVKHEPREAVVTFGREAGDARVKELYEQLAAAKKAAGEAPVAYERVAALVKAQVTKLAGDGSDVAFRIGVKDGKVSLTVKAEKEEGGGS
jgi:hypothetical protein